MSAWGLTTWALTAVGAINWGSIAFTGVNLVETLFGHDTFTSRLVYALVGMAGIWSAYRLINRATRPTPRRIFARF